MRITTYLSLIILVCVVGGYSIEYLISDNFSQLNKKAADYHQHQLAENDLERIVIDVSQYLLAVDLVLGSDTTHLLEGAQKKGHLLLGEIDPLLETIVGKHFQENMLAIKALIESSNQLLEQSSGIVYENRQNGLDELLKRSDKNSSLLVSLLKTTKSDALLLKNQVFQQLETQRDNANRIQTIARISYGLLVLVLWLWVIKKICEPIRYLSSAARAIKNGDSSSFKIDGPVELQQLSESIHDVTKHLSYQAGHDPLTGLINRREFARLLAKVQSESADDTLTAQCANSNDSSDGSAEGSTDKGTEASRTMCFIDLDRFKAINDNCGHAAGDQLLTTLATTIVEVVGEKGIVARMGGDEFAILLNRQRQQECIQLAERILQSIKEIRFEWNGEVFRVSASIGLACIDDICGDTEAWLNKADTACLEAKKLGRDNIQFFQLDTDYLDNKKREGKIYNDIIEALESDRFVLYAQEIVSLQDTDNASHKADSSDKVTRIHAGQNKIFYEVLIRMVGADGKIISPAGFLPVVESLSLSLHMDMWVIENTIEWLMENPRHLANLGRCSINLSGYSITSSKMRDFIISTISASGIPAEKLCFEITETAAIHDISEAQKLIEEVGALGCLFALDDFGSGFSSFSYLQDLAVDILKIDGLFIKNIESNKMHQTIVKSLSDIAKVGGMKTVGEFVENAGIARHLTEFGIDYAQGYHFSVPAPLADKADIKEQVQRA